MATTKKGMEMIIWNTGTPPKEERKFLFYFGKGDVRVLSWAEKNGTWCPYDGDRSYIQPQNWAEINYPETSN